MTGPTELVCEIDSASGIELSGRYIIYRMNSQFK